MPEIWGIILAAGLSHRMGEPKMLLQFGGKTIIRNVVDAALLSSLKGIIVVTGAYNHLVEAAIKDTGVNVCFNEDYEEGMLTSVWKGFRSLPPSCSAAVVMLGDQPFIKPEIINMLSGAWKNKRSHLIVPVCEGKRGHPVVIGTCFADDIYNLDPSVGLKGLFITKKSYIYEIKVDTTVVLRDIDTPEDYLRELNQII